jgi:hypothetical protein
MLERCPLGLPRGEMYPCIVSEEFVSKKLYQKKKFRAVITCRPSLYYTYKNELDLLFGNHGIFHRVYFNWYGNTCRNWKTEEKVMSQPKVNSRWSIQLKQLSSSRIVTWRNTTRYRSASLLPFKVQGGRRQNKFHHNINSKKNSNSSTSQEAMHCLLLLCSKRGENALQHNSPAA